MSISVELNTPLADALSTVIQPKLVEIGWSRQESDDTALAEYVLLMLVNGKTQEQIASEISNDLLGLSDDTEAVEFSRWLFEQVENLNRQVNGQPSAGAPIEAQPAQQQPSEEQHVQQQQPEQQPQQLEQQAQPQQPQEQQFQQPEQEQLPQEQQQAQTQEQGQALEQEDHDMGESPQQQEELQPVPSFHTQPQEYSIPQPMEDQSGFANEGQTSTVSRPQGRSNNTSQRGRQLGQIERHIAGSNALNRIRDTSGSGRINAHANRRGQRGARRGSSLQRFASRGGAAMNGMVNMAGLNPGEQMMVQQQEAVLAMQQQVSQQMFGNRSLFERAQKPSGRGNRNQRQSEGPSKLDQPLSQPPVPKSSLICRFNLQCTNPKCEFAHQSPAAPPGAFVDVSDKCLYAAACKNKKCTARHPSPAQKSSHQSTELCRFFPNCANPQCHFMHPDTPLCSNGGDCQDPNCQYTHQRIPCKYTPCLNPLCPYTHGEGQKGQFGDKIWTPNQGQHVSERQFVDPNAGEEELIKPGAAAGNNNSSNDDEDTQMPSAGPDGPSASEASAPANGVPTTEGQPSNNDNDNDVIE